MNGGVGFGFRPMDDELVGYYLRSKLMGSTSLVDEPVNEIDLYRFDPWKLRFQSKVKPIYPVWYFFSSSNPQTRQTSSGYWKITGPNSEVKDKWGIWGARGIIGYKKNLVFKNVLIPRRGKSDWVMHEYHLTILPQIQKTHVICRVEFKGDDISFMDDNNTAEAFDHQVTNSPGSLFNPQGHVSHFPLDIDFTNLSEKEIEEALKYVHDI